MNPEWEDQEDPLLDSALEEILSGSSPPDLKESILAELDRLKSADRPKSRISRKPTQHAQHFKARQVNPWSGILVVAFGLSVLILTLSYLTNDTTRPPIDSVGIAENAVAPREIAKTTGNVEETTHPSPARKAVHEDAPHEPPNNEQTLAQGVSEEATEVESQSTEEKELVEADVPANASPSFQLASDFRHAQALPTDQIVNSINVSLRNAWKKAGVRAAKPMDFAAFVNLSYEKFLGRAPTEEEAATRMSRHELVDSLLASRECSDHLAKELFSPIGGEKGPDSTRLAKALHNNMPLDKIIENHLGNSNRSPERFGSALLGATYSCGTCHHDSDLPIEKDDAFQLAAQAVDLKAIIPEFASTIAKSDQLSRHMANKLWAHFFEFGLQPKFDHDHRLAPKSHGEIQKLLATQFAAHGFDVKQMAQWISSTEAFHLSADAPNGRAIDQPNMMEFAHFSRRYPPRTIHEPIPRVLNKVAGTFKSTTSQIAGTGILANQLTSTLVKDDVKSKDKKRPNVTKKMNELIVQMNPDASWLLQKIHDTNLETIVRPNMSKQKKVEHVFYMAIGRSPNRRELKTSMKVLDSFLNEVDGLRSIWWTLAHSPEAI